MLTISILLPPHIFFPRSSLHWSRQKIRAASSYCIQYRQLRISGGFTPSGWSGGYLSSGSEIFSPELSTAYSHAPDYFEIACAAIAEMYRQVLDPVMDPDTGLMQRGLIVRHLLLPGQAKDSKKILRYLHETYGDHIYIMNQYTPLPQVADIEALNRTVTPEEYDRVLRFAGGSASNRASGKKDGRQ